MQNLSLAIVLLPLFAAILSGLLGKQLGRKGAHTVTILGVAISCVLSCYLWYLLATGQEAPFNHTLYSWASIGALKFQIGFFVDQLTTMMLVVVTFVSLMVHIYTIGYMHEDPGYQRFFSYIALFTFAMLMLVTANNFLQLFFGWEAVGLVSYLLIGFWYTRDTAIFANLKAFLVNRVGDFGFLLGIACVLAYFGTLDYAPVFEKMAAPEVMPSLLGNLPGTNWPVINVICIGLFVGAMGKSAQVPLHVWLPDSMEGPTPISALIHAATMVTAGVFMLARMSPLFEHSEMALSVVLVIGATTCLFMGFLGVVQNDIKRVVAYSTLSQLGYMITAAGASAYSAAVFHLMTHAFFKALLFLGAGSVIIGMHHEQDIRRMGGIRKYMPITYWTMLLGSLALIGFPGFSGFYSKDLIIEAVAKSQIAGHGYAYFAVLASVFVTALYSFRMFFLVFHTKERMDDHTKSHLHESPAVVWVPLVLLAVPSVVIGAMSMGPIFDGYFGKAITVLPQHDVVAALAKHYHGWLAFALHGLQLPPFWFALSGVAAAWFLYIERPSLPEKIRQRVSWLHRLMLNKYGFDDFNQRYIAGGVRTIGGLFSRVGDRALIDGLCVNGTAKTVGRISAVMRWLQSGYLYHYAFVMVIGLLGLFIWLFQRIS